VKYSLHEAITKDNKGFKRYYKRTFQLARFLVLFFRRSAEVSMDMESTKKGNRTFTVNKSEQRELRFLKNAENLDFSRLSAFFRRYC